MNAHEVFAKAPIVIILEPDGNPVKQYVIARNVTSLDGEILEDNSQYISCNNTTAIIADEQIVSTEDLDAIVWPLDVVLGTADDGTSITGGYVGINPLDGHFILMDDSGIMHSVVDIQSEDVCEESDCKIKAMLDKMRKMLDLFKTNPEPTRELLGSLEGELSEIYKTLDEEM